MPVPDSISQAVNKLQSDADDLAVAQADAATKRQAAVDAAHAADVADNVVTSGKAQMNSDRESLISLIKQTYPTDG